MFDKTLGLCIVATHICFVEIGGLATSGSLWLVCA